jgi:hypothetical protein
MVVATKSQKHYMLYFIQDELKITMGNKIRKVVPDLLKKTPSVI